jgi:hypothetical protein
MIYKKCPTCIKKAYRRLDIHNDWILWKCKECGKIGREKLFTLQKKIIYLDQLVYSNVLKSSDQNEDNKWGELGKTIKKLVEDQIMVCPYSTVHQTETELYETYYNEITDLYRSYSAGIAFKDSYQIEQNQILHSFLNFLAENNSEVYNFPWNHALRSNPHQWSSRFSVFVNISLDLDEIKKRSILKEETRRDMQRHYDEVLKKEKKTFEEDIEIEKKGASDLILIAHSRNLQLYQDIRIGKKEPGSILELQCDHFDWLKSYIRDKTKLKLAPVEVIKKFLYTEEFFTIPYVDIWAYLLASLNQKVRASNRKAEAGDYYDIRAISHFLPYCDVMVIDNEFRGLLEERGAPILKKYNTEVFSGKTLNKFFELLDKWISESRIEEIRQIYDTLDRSSLF